MQIPQAGLRIPLHARGSGLFARARRTWAGQRGSLMAEAVVAVLIFTLVGTGEKHIDRLIEESALSAGEVSGALMSLELKGLVRQFPGKIFARA